MTVEVRGSDLITRYWMFIHFFSQVSKMPLGKYEYNLTFMVWDNWWTACVCVRTFLLLHTCRNDWLGTMIFSIHTCLISRCCKWNVCFFFFYYPWQICEYLLISHQFQELKYHSHFEDRICREWLKGRSFVSSINLRLLCGWEDGMYFKSFKWLKIGSVEVCIFQIFKKGLSRFFLSLLNITP